MPYIIQRKSGKKWIWVDFTSFKTKMAARTEISKTRKSLLENPLINKTEVRKVMRSSNFRIVPKETTRREK